MKETLPVAMHIVYLIRSLKFPDRVYVGYSTDLRQRIHDHNLGLNPSTRRFRPWQIIWYAVFADANLARAFEHYLKTASGIAFRRKRLI